MENFQETYVKADRKKLKAAAIEIGMLDRLDMENFVQELFKNFTDVKRKNFLDFALLYQFPDKGVWLRIEEWMQKCFLHDPEISPRAVASMCRRYKRLKWEIMPELVRRAQKVKDRVRKRQSRAAEKQEGPAGLI
jgi:hypothetical protein